MYPWNGMVPASDHRFITVWRILFMRRTVILSLIILFLVVGVLAQGPPAGTKKGPPDTPGHSDDHDDNATVQKGYAVVTSASTSGLVVFETFGLKNGPDTTQAGVLPPALTTSAVMFVDSNGRLS